MFVLEISISNVKDVLAYAICNLLTEYGDKDTRIVFFIVIVTQIRYINIYIYIISLAKCQNICVENIVRIYWNLAWSRHHFCKVHFHIMFKLIIWRLVASRAGNKYMIADAG